MRSKEDKLEISTEFRRPYSWGYVVDWTLEATPT